MDTEQTAVQRSPSKPGMAEPRWLAQLWRLLYSGGEPARSPRYACNDLKFHLFIVKIRHTHCSQYGSRGQHGGRQAEPAPGVTLASAPPRVCDARSRLVFHWTLASRVFGVHVSTNHTPSGPRSLWAAAASPILTAGVGRLPQPPGGPGHPAPLWIRLVFSLGRWSITRWAATSDTSISLQVWLCLLDPREEAARSECGRVSRVVQAVCLWARSLNRVVEAGRPCPGRLAAQHVQDCGLGGRPLPEPWLGLCFLAGLEGPPAHVWSACSCHCPGGRRPRRRGRDREGHRVRARGASAARKDPGGQGTLRTRRNLLAKLRVDVGRPVPSAARSRCRTPGAGAGPSVAAGGHGLGPDARGAFFNPLNHERPVFPTGVSCSVTRVYIYVSCQ